MSYVLMTVSGAFLDVCSIDTVVIIWANLQGDIVCRKYDDVGVCIGRVDLAKTKIAKRVIMSYPNVTA